MDTNTPSTPLPLDPEWLLGLVQQALIDQQVTVSTHQLCALNDETQQLAALQSAVLLDVMWEGALVQNPDVSTVFWAQVQARLDEQHRAQALLPYINVQGTLFGLSLHAQCASVIELAVLHLTMVCAQTWEGAGKEALLELLEQLDENLFELRVLTGEQFEMLAAPAYEALKVLEAEPESEGKVALCAQTLSDMLLSALRLEPEELVS